MPPLISLVRVRLFLFLLVRRVVSAIVPPPPRRRPLIVPVDGYPSSYGVARLIEFDLEEIRVALELTAEQAESGGLNRRDRKRQLRMRETWRDTRALESILLVAIVASSYRRI